MAQAISFDESYWVEDIDDTDPQSLSSVSVDYTPAFTLAGCFKENFDVYLKYMTMLDPLEADVLIFCYYNDKKVKDVARILKTTPVKVSALLSQAEKRLAQFLQVNILTTQRAVHEITKKLSAETDKTIFFSFLRELSRRRVAQVMGLSYQDITVSLRRSVRDLYQSSPSIELRELLDLVNTMVKPARETRQLDISDRTWYFDVISCPQQSMVEALNSADLSMGNFFAPVEELWEEANGAKFATSASYWNISQTLIAKQLMDETQAAWGLVSPPYVVRFTAVEPKMHVGGAKPVAPVVRLYVKPPRRKHHAERNPYSNEKPLLEVFNEAATSGASL